MVSLLILITAHEWIQRTEITMKEGWVDNTVDIFEYPDEIKDIYFLNFI